MQLDLNKFKSSFSLPERGGYFNCAAQGPLSRPASAAVLQGVKDKENPACMNMEYGKIRALRCRDAISRLVDWPAENIALTNSTTFGMNLLARGLKFQPGDEIIVFEGQFPSNVLPWEFLKSKGVTITKIPCPGFIADLTTFKKHLSSKTRLVSLEWVHFISGDRIPLQEYSEICRQRGIKVVVDATQGIGAIPYSMKDMG